MGKTTPTLQGGSNSSKHPFSPPCSSNLKMSSSSNISICKNKGGLRRTKKRSVLVDRAHMWRLLNSSIIKNSSLIQASSMQTRPTMHRSFEKRRNSATARRTASRSIKPSSSTKFSSSKPLRCSNNTRFCHTNSNSLNSSCCSSIRCSKICSNSAKRT